MKRVAWFTVIILGTLAGIYLLFLFREAVILFLLSLATAAAARPFVDGLESKHVPRVISLLVVYLSFLLLIAGIFFFISGSIILELESLADHFVVFYESLWATWPTGNAIQQAIVQLLPSPNGLSQVFTGSQGNTILQTLLGVTVSSITTISQLIAVLVLSLYWSIDQFHFERLWLSLLPVENRAKARAIWSDLEKGVGGYIRSEIAQSLFVGVLLWLGYHLMGLQYPVLLSTYGAVVWLIPWLGAVLALIPVIPIGFSGGLALGIGALVYTVAVLVFMEVYVQPRLINRQRYSSLLTVIFVITLADIFGILGILIAPPLAAATEIFFGGLMSSTPPQESPESVRQIEELEARLARVRSEVERQPGASSPETLGMLERLEDLIQQTNEMLME
ncbi:MAG: AI-2E family transporter [Chloroflexi bacterium]|nr:AI-2E family transporter [Chloroflexota bacterium]